MAAAFGKILLEPAKPEDALAIAELSRDLIESGLGWSWTPGRVAREIHNPDTLVLAARLRGSLVGFGIMNFGTDTAHLSLFAVHRGCQRRGIGRRMFQWMQASALTAGIAVIRLELRADNRAACVFYRGLGFRETGCTPGYYRGRVTALRMELDLRHAAQCSR